MSSEVKQLIVVAEGTSALGFYWKTIVSDYLEKIIRSFCGTELNEEGNPVSNVELSLVSFNSRGPSGGCLVQRSGCTRDVDLFLRCLSYIQFSGGGFNEAATAEGLAEALMMFSPPSSQDQPSNDFKRHCILIAASDPYPLPTPVYLPPLQTVEQNENNRRLSDAETVASYFSRLSISLSVVCPRQLQKIRALYNAAKLNKQSADLSIFMVKNKYYLVLISENFVEAHAALSHSASHPVEVERATVAPSLPVTVEPVPTATSWNPVEVKVVPSIPSVAQPATQAIPSASPVSQHIKAVVGGMTPPLQAGPSGPLRMDNISQVLETVFPSGQQEITSMAPSDALMVPARVGQSPGPSNSSSPQETTPWLIQGSHSSRPMQTSQSKLVKFWEGDLSQGQTVPITRLTGYRSRSASDSLAANWPPTLQILRLITQDHMNKKQYVGKADFLVFQPISEHEFLRNLQAKKLCAVIQLPSQRLVLYYSDQGLIGKLFPEIPNQPQQQLQQQQQQQMPQLQQQQQQLSQQQQRQPQQDGGGEQQPTMPGVGQQTQSGIQKLGGSNSSACNMQTSQSKPVKVWEGNLVGHRKGQPVLITTLKGYRSASASDSLAANWPPTLQILSLITQDHMDKQYVCRTDFLMFRPMTQHRFLEQLQAKKLCAVIRLPLQTLLLCYYSEKDCLIGKLFPGDMLFMFERQNPNQPQQQLQQQQQIQQQQLQQQQQQQQQEQPRQMVESGVMGGQAFAQAPGRSQQEGDGEQQPTMPGAGFMK